jgi:hypothetical protein
MTNKQYAFWLGFIYGLPCGVLLSAILIQIVDFFL